MATHTEAARNDDAAIPLIVDLDGTLTPTDVFVEDAFAYMGSRLFNIVKFAGTLLLRGKAAAKQLVASQPHFSAATLPYSEGVLHTIHQAKAAGRNVYLATATNEARATSIANHLKLFDGVFASSGTHNLSGSRKAALLVEKFGDGKFDYIGNEKADLKVWRVGREAYTINDHQGLKAKLAKMGKRVHDLGRRKSEPKVWLKAIRVHQYTKNVLVFLPLFASHSFTQDAIINALLAFAAFCAAASSIYLINDLIDVHADRAHPSKRKRPLAAGKITPHSAVSMAAFLFVVALILAVQASLAYAGILLIYVALTTAYSLFIKRKMFIDIIVLSMLYTIRVWAGAVAIDVELSNWLLTFSLFLFTSLALIKRYTELALRLELGLEDPTNRNYRKEDLPVIGALAAACAVNSVTIFALYISSEAVAKLYTNPNYLWVICPILLYLLGRMLIMAQRREMHDDPIVFVIHDRIWRMAIPLMAAVFLLAMAA